MSKEVDERVVEMRFDNAKFEKNTRQTMKTLQELNESLKLEGAEKGFEKIEDASAKVDFDKMQGAVEGLSSKFSALEVMGVTALVRITNQAIDTGEKLVKSLSIDQVTSGWNKYAQKTASVQTIMNATGKSITKVNSYLDKLMWYSDETSYGFTDMTASLGQLTAAGGDIDKLIPMIMGIANATAYAGKGASEFSRVIYNLNQSYSQGYLSLMDWKSVELAGVATAELKQLLIDTAVEQGKLKKGAVNVGSFGSTLSKKWADKEVMEAGFGKLAEFTMAVKNLQESDPKQYSTAAKAIEALEDQYDEVTVKAFKAAQEAKSFTEAVDATKDAVSSGWMETFDILFGNYEEAKGFWSDLADEFWDIFAGGQDARNNWLRSAFDSGLDQLLGTEGFSDATDNYTNLLQKALMNVGLVTEDGIKEAGSFQKALEESGVTAQQLYAVVDKGAEVYGELLQKSDAEIKKVGGSREEVEKLYNAYKSLRDQILDGTVSLNDFADKMNQLSGREHFFNGILNILEGIKSILQPMRDAFGEVFMTDGSPLYNLLKGFDELTGKFVMSEETAEKIQKVFKGVFSVLDVGFKGVKIVAKTALMVLEQVLDILSPIGDMLLTVGSYIGNVLTWVDLSLGQAENLTDVLTILATAVGGLISPIYDLWQGFLTFIRGGDVDEAKQQFGAFGMVVNAAGAVLDRFTAGSETAGSIIGTVFQVLGGVALAAFDGISFVIGKAFGGLQDAGNAVNEFAQSNVPVLEKIRDTVLSLPEKAEEALKDFGGTLGSIMSTIVAACKTALDAVVEFFNLQNGVDIYRLLALLDVGALALGIGFVAKALNAVSTATKNLLKNPVTNFFDALTNTVNNWNKAHTTNNLVTAAKGIATAVAMISGSIYLLSTIKDPKAGLEALKTVLISIMTMLLSMKVLSATDLSGLDTGKMVASVVALSAGVAVMSTAVVKVGKMQTGQVENGINAISRIVAMLAGIMGLLSLYNGKLGGIKGAGSFAAAAAAVDAVALALIPLAMAASAGLDIDAACEVINGVAIALSILITAAGFAQKLAGKSDEKALDKAIAFAAKIGVLVLAVNGMASALLITAAAVGAFAAMGDKMWAGLAGAGAALAGLATVAGILGKLDLKGVKKSAKAMVIMSAALTAAAGAVYAFSEVAAIDNGQGFTGALLALISLGAAVGVLGKMKTDALNAAESMALISGALVLFAVAIEMMGTTGVEKGLSGCVAAIGALTVLGAAMVLLPSMDKSLEKIGSAALKLSAALLVLAPAMMLLGQLDFQHAVAGVVAFIGLIAGLVGASLFFGAIKPMADGIKVLTGALTDLAKAFSIFAGGAVKLGLAVGVIAILSKFAGPICEAITTAAPDIKAALVQILMVISQAIMEGMPYITAALLAILAGIAQVVVDGAPYIVTTLVGIFAILEETIVQCIGMLWDNNGSGGGIKGALEELWGKIDNWIQEQLDAHPWYVWLFGNVRGDTGEIQDNPYKRTVDGWLSRDAFSGMGGGRASSGSGSGRKNGIQDNADAKNQNVSATRNQIDAENAYVAAARKSAEETRNATGITNIATKATQDYEKATIEVTDASGRVYCVTAEQAAAMMGTRDAASSLADAQRYAENSVNDTTGAVNASATAINAYAGKTAAVENTIAQTKKAVKDSEGDIKDQVEKTVDDGTAGIVTIAAENGSEAGAALKENFLNSVSGTVSEIWNALTGGRKLNFEESISKLAGDASKKMDTSSIIDGLKGVQDNINLTKEDFFGQLTGAPNYSNGSGRSGNTGSGKKGSSGTKKTVAQQIEEKYKTKLEANKTQREILDNEYELWQEENQYSADIDTQMAKKAENAAAEIANQTERVTIAQQKYDEMTKRWGKDKQETKEAYNDLLEEKTSLAKLKAEQYTNLFEAATTRYDADLETLEKEYNLWSTQNDKTATKLDKLDRETQYQNDELAIKQKKVDNAKEQYETMRREYGESDLRTIEAHNDLLDAQAEALEIQNDLAHKELDRLDILIENIQTAQSRMQSRMDILSTVYDDGSLKEREDAYKQAVEEYGKDSKQAKKAQFQGTTSAILSTVTALKNLNYQMQQTKKYEEELSGMTPGTEEYDNKMSDILSSKSSFIGFASNLADALNMEDTGKKAMLILANSMQDHWKEIDTAMKNVMDKVTKGMSDGLKATFKDVFDTMSSDEFAQMGTEFISTVTSALQGDWAGAVASAIAFAMDFAFSNTGKKIQSDMVKLFSDNVVPAIKNSVGSIDKLVNGEGGLVAILQNGSVQAGNALAGSGGITAALGSIGTTLTEVGGVLMGFLSEFWWVFLIIGAIAAVVAAIVGGIAWSKKKKSDAAKDAGSDLDKDFADGVTGGKDQVDDAVDDMTKDTTDSLTAAIATIKRVMDDDYQYEPTITPVLDMTDAGASMDAWNQAFNDYPMNADVSKKMAAQVDATAELQNEARMQSNAELLNAVNVLGDRMDSVGQSIQGMNVVVDGKTTIGWIDAGLGARAARRAR